jgi:homoserine kinase type II
MAVYTKVSPDDVAIFLRAYDIGTLTELVGIKQGIQNTNYLLRTTKGKYILTLYEQRNVREEDLPFFLGLMEHLAQKGVACPLPIRPMQGELVSRLCGCPAAIIGFLVGKTLGRITPEDCEGLGHAMADMHVASADFPLRRANTLGLPDWERLLAACKSRADEVRAGLGALLQTLPRGVIHADLFPDNVFTENNLSYDMFDFYFACNDFLAYDLAICLNAWCFEYNTSFNVTKARALISGYTRVRPLCPLEIDALPVLARGAAMRFLLTRLYDWLHQVPDALVKPKDPLEYLSRLHFHQMVTDVASYGISA